MADCRVDPDIAANNNLLGNLSAADLALLIPYLERVSLQFEDVILQPDKPVDYAYFPTDGIVSIVAVTSSEKHLEVGLYGREGMGPVSILLGDNQNRNIHLVQAAGAAFRIEAATLTKIMMASPTLRALLHRYVLSVLTQINLTAVANSSGVLIKRLSRWLLMCHDRLDTDDIPMKHAFMSAMLGVRRAGVTDAIHILEGKHLIRANRRLIRIVDREGLESTAGDIYGLAEAEYERLLGPIPSKRSSDIAEASIREARMIRALRH